MFLAAYLSPLIAFLAAVLGIRLLLSERLARLVLDEPNHRSLHTQAVPRTGGLALMAGTMAGWIWAGVPPWLAAATIGLMAVSLWDDVRGLPVRWRFLAHLVAAGVLLSQVMPQGHGLFWLILMLPAVVWAINLYNFMDGSDGLAGGMALFGFGAYGLAAALHGDGGFASMNFTLVAGAAAFLLFNFHPARIFMGDAGSIPLGFLAAAFGILGWEKGLWQWWFPLLVFSPFTMDASVTLLKRLLRGEKIWLAHRDHYYQRLVRMGWSHRKLALLEYALMAGVGLASVWGVKQEAATQFVLGMGCLLAYLLAMALIDRHWKAFGLRENMN